MECVLQYISEAEALAEDRSGAITHQQCCGGLAKHVLDHTALFLRGLRSCDSAFLFSARPLDAVNACNTPAHTHIHTRTYTDACKQTPPHEQHVVVEER